jgi:hypothetical protein
MTSSNNTNKYQGRVFEAKDNFVVDIIYKECRPIPSLDPSIEISLI